MRVWIAAAFLACAACTDDRSSPSQSADMGSDTGMDSGTQAPDVSDADGARTLANCQTRIGEGVPDFFARYFRCVDIQLDGDEVVIQTDNLPPHPTYYYGEGHPNYVAFDTSRGDQYRPNPNTLDLTEVTVRVPLAPVAKGLTVFADMVDTQMNTSPEEYGGGPRGVALDSVVLFDDQAAPGDDIAEEFFTFDSFFAHPAGTMYHYHTASPGPLEVLADLGLTTSTVPTKGDIELYGVMCDGTVVLGCTELDGGDITGDLDAQNGHVHDLVDELGNTMLAQRYHTHVCEGRFSHVYGPEIQYYQACSVEAPRP